MAEVIEDPKTVGPPQIIAPPSRTPILHGIRGQITPVPPTFVPARVEGEEPALDERWKNGLTWVAPTCGLTWGTWVPCRLDDQGEPVSGLSDPMSPGDIEEYQPFTIELAESCSAGTDRDALRSLALSQIEDITEWALSREFWHGQQVPTNFALVQTEPTAPVEDDRGGYLHGGVINPNVLAADPGDQATTVATPVGQDVAFDLLLEYLSRCGGATRGVIHASYGLISRWSRGNNLRANGARLQTTVGGHLVIGHYARPDGPLDRPDRLHGTGGQWAYATGPIELRLSDAAVQSEMPSTRPPQLQRDLRGQPLGPFNSRTNRLTYRVSREAAVTTDPCCVFAVRVEALA